MLIVQISYSQHTKKVNCSGIKINLVSTSGNISNSCVDFKIIFKFENITSIEMQNVIISAGRAWTNSISKNNLLPCEFPISVKLGKTQSSGNLAEATSDVNADGVPLNGQITISDSKIFYLNPDHDANEEFSDFDLLSIMIHEIGHIFGWNEYSRGKDKLKDGYYDSEFLNIPFGIKQQAIDYAHTSISGSVMYFATGEGERQRLATYPDLSLIGSKLNFEFKKIRIVRNKEDNNNSIGSFSDPYSFRSILENSTIIDLDLILYPDKYKLNTIDKMKNVKIIAPHKRDVILYNQN